MASGSAGSSLPIGDRKAPEDLLGRLLPLPYRVAVVIVLGIWAWGWNLKFLHDLRIDVGALIKYTSRGGPGNPPYQRIFRLASTASALLVASLVVFWAVTQGDGKSVVNWQILPHSFLVLLIALFVVPMKRLSKNGRYRFLSTLKRISIGGIAEAQDGRFGDILLADALTSYSRVCGDLFATMCMLVTGRSSTSVPDRSCASYWLFPVVIAIPSAIRLRQCLIEYSRVRRNPTTSAGWGGQHLANALKYATAFPVIALAAMQRASKNDTQGLSHARTPLFACWIAACFVNASYSFWWDVTKDWDFSLLTAVRDNLEFPYGLRRRLHFQPRSLYYSVIALDLVLRLTWTLKISAHFTHWTDGESGIFMLELLEVFRRWVWIFFRVETEWVRVHAGPLMDDILMEEYEREEADKLDID